MVVSTVAALAVVSFVAVMFVMAVVLAMVLANAVAAVVAGLAGDVCGLCLLRLRCHCGGGDAVDGGKMQWMFGLVVSRLQR